MVVGVGVVVEEIKKCWGERLIKTEEMVQISFRANVSVIWEYISSAQFNLRYSRLAALLK